MSNIIILNGAARKDGNTNKLVQAFIDGAITNHNKIEEFHLNNMGIRGCTGCEGCKQNTSKDNPHVQDDEMQFIYKAFEKADIVVFASPIYFWTITGPLKTVTDRLYAMLSKHGFDKFKKESILIMTAGSTDYSQAQKWYETFENNLGWTNRG